MSAPIKLYQFPAMLGVPNPSLFCFRVEAWLRLAGIPYETRVMMDPRKSPLGKLPYIRDGETVVADSHTIIEYLTQTRGVTLDAKLSDEQRGVARAFERMLNEHSYWAVLHARWIDADGWAQLKPVFFGGVPKLARNIVSKLIRGKIARSLKAHGLGLHGGMEIYRRVAQDVEALALYLGSKPYFFGDSPSSIDATVYAALASMSHAELDTALKPLVAGYPNLVAYAERMRKLCGFVEQ